MHAKKIYSIAGIVILAIIIVAASVYTKRLRLQSPIVLLPAGGQTVTSSKVQPVQGIGDNSSFNSLQEISEGTATEQISYQQAIQMYRFTHLTFDPNCRVNPVTLVMPPKSIVMFDNQSKWQRSITVGSRTYTIAPYDFVLAAFNASGAYDISCDSVQNVGSITVQ